MSLLEDEQDSFGGPRRARYPDHITDTLPADLDFSGFRGKNMGGVPVNVLDKGAEMGVGGDADANFDALTEAIEEAAETSQEVLIPGIMALSDEFVDESEVLISGYGSRSKLLWTGAAGATMYTKSVELAYGGGFNRVVLDCNSLATVGLLVLGSSHGYYSLDILNPKADANSCNIIFKGNNTFTCSYNRIPWLWLSGTTNGKACMWWTGTPPNSNACWNHFGYVKMVHGGTRHGLLRGYDDNNHVDNLVAYRDSGTGKGITADITEATDFPRDDTFDKMSAGAGGFVIPAGAGYTARIGHYSTSNGEPAPVTNDRPLAYGNGDCQQYARSFTAQGVDTVQLAVMELLTSNYGTSWSKKTALIQYETASAGTSAGVGQTGMLEMLFQKLTTILFHANGASTYAWANSGVVRMILGLGVNIGGLSDPGAGRFAIATSLTPASAAASGVAGTIAWDASYIYVCVAANTWKRVAIATW